MDHPKETSLCSSCLELFLARSNLFKLAMTCYWLFRFLQAPKPQNVLTYKFTITKLLERSASISISGTAFLELQNGQVVLQSRAGNTKYDNFYYEVGKLSLQGGTTITK